MLVSHYQMVELKFKNTCMKVKKYETRKIS